MELGNTTSVAPALAQETGNPSTRRPSHEAQQAVAAQGGSNDRGIERSKLVDAVSTANDLAQTFSERHLNFSVDGATDRLVVRVVDDKGDVIRQIPAQEMLNLIAHFDKIKALLFSGKY